MKRFRFLFALLILLSFTHSEAADAPPKLLSWSELSAMALPAPAKRITYGSGPQQFGELRLPKGAGPFPVVVIVHGGCWMAAFDYVYMTRLAAWLAERGVASWTIEYRRVGDEGGGWPGTFLDVANATDDLRNIAKTEPIDLKRVYAAGHSAGGQLALWLATRARLPKESEIYRPNPLTIRGVLGLAAVTDLYEYRKGSPESCHGSVDQVMGGSPEKYPRRYAETSPEQLLPLGVPQVFIQGDDDPIVDPGPVRTYVEAAKKAGDRAELLALPNAGHFEASVPLPPTEATFEQALYWLLQPNNKSRTR
ncbi:MAG: alpha/beta hydrolase [Chthoniobacterales bacterium]